MPPTAAPTGDGVAQRLEAALRPFLRGDLPVGLVAWDGSTAGPADAPVVELRSPDALRRLLWHPGELGAAQAYVTGELDVPGDLDEALTHAFAVAEQRGLSGGRPGLRALAGAVRTAIGLDVLGRPPAPPATQARIRGRLHSKDRDRRSISHHYDTTADFYALVLDPETMAYSCGYHASPDQPLAEAQHAKLDLVCRKLGLEPGMRLLDVGCGWGSMVRHAAREYGVKALGVTLSLEQAQWAKEAIDREGLGDLAEVRHLDYRDVVEGDFDAISSIGLLEHIGVRNYPSYFSHLRDRLKPGGRLLNHCITRPHNQRQQTGAFIDRYVFPDGELIGSGTIITQVQDAGLEVQHEENFRVHYAKTLAGWCQNLVDNWDECVAEVGEGTARVWGLYMAGSRMGFERNEIQLHQVLAGKTSEDGTSGFPLRPTWLS